MAFGTSLFFTRFDLKKQAVDHYAEFPIKRGFLESVCNPFWGFG